MIYDCFTFFNELELLTLRLNELKDSVDKFVLVEANRTFQGAPKPYVFEENKHLFKEFLDQIIHVKVDDFPPYTDAWGYEIFQRNAITRALTDCAPEDTIIISDVDEIPNVQAVHILENLSPLSGIVRLRQRMYSYFMDWMCFSRVWHPPVAISYKNLLLNSPQIIRKYYRKSGNLTIHFLKNAGWHFNYMGGIERITKKLESFGHSELNTPEFKNPERLLRMIAQGTDLTGAERYSWVPIDRYFPRYLRENLKLFQTLLYPSPPKDTLRRKIRRQWALLRL